MPSLNIKGIATEWFDRQACRVLAASDPLASGDYEQLNRLAAATNVVYEFPKNRSEHVTQQVLP